LCIFKATSNVIGALVSAAVSVWRETYGRCALPEVEGDASTGLVLSGSTTVVGVSAWAFHGEATSVKAAPSHNLVR
jgi:hypothetical protein